MHSIDYLNIEIRNLNHIIKDRQLTQGKLAYIFTAYIHTSINKPINQLSSMNVNAELVYLKNRLQQGR